MAYINPLDQQQPGQEVPAPGPVPAGGSGAAGTAYKQVGTKQAASVPGVNVPQAPSAQLSAYLNANQGNAAVANQAGQVAGNLGNQTQAAVAGIPGAINTYTGQLNPVATNTAVNQQVETAPSGLTADQQAAYTTELGAAGNAPNSASTFEASSAYQPIATQVQNAVEQANLWSSGNNLPNITTALQPYEQGNTSGGQTLDAYLLSQTPQAYGQIEQAVAPAAGLQTALTTGTTQADQALQAAIAQDQAATAAAQAAPQTYSTNLTNYLNQAVSDKQAAATAANAQIQADLANNTLTASDEAALGITAAQGQVLLANYQGASAAQQQAQTAANLLKYGQPKKSVMPQGAAASTTPATPTVKGVDLSSYLTGGNPSSINAQNTATAADYANVAALQKLLGQGNVPVNPLTGATAQPAVTGTGSYNLTGANTALTNATSVAGLQKQYDAIREKGKVLSAAYNANHAGGQTPDEFNAMLGKLDGQISAINKQLVALGEKPMKMIPLMSAPNNSGLFGMGNDVSNPLTTAAWIFNPVGPDPWTNAALKTGLDLSGTNTG